MTTITETIVDENCVEVNVTYMRFEDTIELDAVEVVIAGTAINILPQLSDRQQQNVIDNLSNEPSYEVL